jgi:hypothetical protein
MKPYTYSILAAIFACGMAQGAATAYTTPVGYETLDLAAGYNYLGLRLQGEVKFAGKLTGVTTSSVSDSSVDFTTLDDAKTYILEVENANGVTQEILGSAAGGVGGHDLTTPDLSAKVAVNDLYKVRVAATLNSIFGAANQAGLESSAYGPGGDIIYFPTGSANFNLYYYDDFNASWSDYGTGEAVNGDLVALNYADSFLIYGGGVGASTLTVTGEVKTKTTGFNLDPGYNFVGSVYPARATLSSTFDEAVTLNLIDRSAYGPGGDIVYVPTGGGNFNLYYYDDFNASWSDYGTGEAVTASGIDLTSGVIIYNEGLQSDVVGTAPTGYNSL